MRLRPAALWRQSLPLLDFKPGQLGAHRASTRLSALREFLKRLRAGRVPFTVSLYGSENCQRFLSKPPRHSCSAGVTHIENTKEPEERELDDLRAFSTLIP